MYTHTHYLLQMNREYGEMVKSRMESVGVRVEMATLNPTVSLSDALDNAAQRGLLYCVIITSQHEVHRSVTLTILHGRNPQGKWVVDGKEYSLNLTFLSSSIRSRTALLN